MKRSRYGEPDYAFGQLMLTLRTHMGLTQASLAKLLGISRRAPVATLSAARSLASAGSLCANGVAQAVPVVSFLPTVSRSR